MKFYMYSFEFPFDTECNVCRKLKKKKVFNISIFIIRKNNFRHKIYPWHEVYKFKKIYTKY